MDMDKRTVMQFLKDCDDLRTQYSFLEAREEYLNNCIKSLNAEPDIAYKKESDSIAIGVVLSSLLLGAMGTPIAAIVLAIFWRPARFLYDTFHWTFADAHPFWTHILSSFVIITILAIPLAILMCKGQKKTELEGMEKYRKAIAERPAIEQELKTLAQKKQVFKIRKQQLLARGILHPDYFRYANDLWWYLEKGRADTLKDAINLLEFEHREEARDKEIENHYREMERQTAAQTAALADIQDETSRAADAAQRSAAWEAATTIIVASEAERQRKKDRNQ